jgi:hypothetical protein
MGGYKFIFTSMLPSEDKYTTVDLDKDLPIMTPLLLALILLPVRL